MLLSLPIDPELNATLRRIRQSVRDIFEQLRLRGEPGDVSGKDRLERVPALAKRNFANLFGSNPGLAAREAWRLIDLLEGQAGSKLTAHAREGLRSIELDQHLARCRLSDDWKQAAEGLRKVLGILPAAAEDNPIGVSDRSEECLPGPAGARRDPVGPSAAERSGISALWYFCGGRGWRRPLLVGVMVGSIALASDADVPVQLALKDEGERCLPLEAVSPSLLNAHRSVGHPPYRSQDRDIAGSRPAVVTISDPPDGSVRSIYTTSHFSFDDNAPYRPEGGGRADVRLRVGGWADTYLSLLRFPLPHDHPARRAILRLVVLGDEQGSRPTTMTLRIVRSPWIVPVGSENRLWWKDCPRSTAYATDLPAPGLHGSNYDIDITEIYNGWVKGYVVNYGVLLEPNNIGGYQYHNPQYSNFSTFYSTRAIDVQNRPKLILYL